MTPCKESSCQCRRCKRCGLDPWFGEIPWRRQWWYTPIILPRKCHGHRNMVGYSPWAHKELDTTERAHTHMQWKLWLSDMYLTAIFLTMKEMSDSLQGNSYQYLWSKISVLTWNLEFQKIEFFLVLIMFSNENSDDVNNMIYRERIYSGCLRHIGTYCRVLNGLQSHF